MADAVAALTTLALIVWPLRLLADVRDRQKAFNVACGKLDTALAFPELPTLTTTETDPEAPARTAGSINVFCSAVRSASTFWELPRSIALAN